MRQGRAWRAGISLMLLVVAAACAPTADGPPPGARTGDQNGSLGACSVFPPDNAWNTDISDTTVHPTHPNSAGFITQIQSDGGDFLHADFGGGGAYGIPYITVPGTEPRVPVSFVDWPSESDPGPYPIPLGAPIEGGSDRHVLAIDRDRCMLYEMFNAWPRAARWDASNGAVWDLSSNARRPNTWTSADAAGLPIFAGLAR
jgi:hypothetical protein